MEDNDDIYELKPEAVVNYSGYLNIRLDYKALTHVYDFIQIDKEILLRGCLEQHKSNPNIETIINAFNILEKYRAGYVVKSHEDKISIPKPQNKVNKIKSIYVEPLDIYMKEKKAWIGGVLGLLFGPLGLFYISWKCSIGVFLGGIVMFLVTPYFMLVAPLVAFSFGIFGVREYNKKLEDHHYETDFSFGLADKLLQND